MIVLWGHQQKFEVMTLSVEKWIGDSEPIDFQEEANELRSEVTQCGHILQKKNEKIRTLQNDLKVVKAKV